MDEISKGLIIGAMFLAATVVSSKKSTTTIGCCGKTDCNSGKICLCNGGDCPEEFVV